MNGPEPDARPPTWEQGGRSPRWRLGMVLGGALVAGFGVALWLRPQILIWLLSAAFVGLGLVLVLSGLLARGR